MLIWTHWIQAGSALYRITHHYEGGPFGGRDFHLGRPLAETDAWEQVALCWLYCQERSGA